MWTINKTTRWTIALDKIVGLKMIRFSLQLREIYFICVPWAIDSVSLKYVEFYAQLSCVGVLEYFGSLTLTLQ